MSLHAVVICPRMAVVICPCIHFSETTFYSLPESKSTEACVDYEVEESLRSEALEKSLEVIKIKLLFNLIYYLIYYLIIIFWVLQVLHKRIQFLEKQPFIRYWVTKTNNIKFLKF